MNVYLKVLYFKRYEKINNQNKYIGLYTSTSFENFFPIK